MAEYKDVERVKTSLRNLCGGCCYRNSSNCPDDCGAIEAIRAIDSVPREDAVPVRHGRWVSEYTTRPPKETDVCCCSVCHDYYTTEAYNLRYCPRCGAKMDRKDGDDGNTN